MWGTCPGGSGGPHLMLPPGGPRAVGAAVGSTVVQPRQKVEVLKGNLRSADAQLLSQLPHSCPLASLDCSTRHVRRSINLASHVGAPPTPCQSGKANNSWGGGE